MTVKQCIAERRSTRAFMPCAVEDDKVSAVVEAGLFAPSALNEQPWLFTVLSSAAKLEKLNGAVKAMLASSDIERISSRAADNSFSFFYKAPTLIIVSCDDSARFPREDAACALQNMFLAAHELGLGTCWINQLCGAANDNDDIRALFRSFGIPDTHRVYGCCALGYVKTATEPKPRRGEVRYIK